MRTVIPVLAAALVIGCAAQVPAGTTACTSPAAYSEALLESGHAPVNGIRMYYEVHGRTDGVPLVLLHGGGSTIESTFGRLLPCLARHRHVIALEEQGHGRTSDRDEPFSFESSADDVAALLQHLDVERADLFGFSNGASVALQVAIRHPERLPAGHGDYLGEIMAAEHGPHDPELTARLVERFLAAPQEE